jgi:polar amino acid transport system substrate-binding protein
MNRTMRCFVAMVGLMALVAGVLPAAAQAQALPLVKGGEFTAATNATIPPYQFVDASGKLQGMRIELGEELAKRLGLKMTWVNVGFETHIPGLQSGRWDVSITGMFFTPERAKILYLIPYEYQAISVAVPKGNPQKITSPKDLAGKRVAVEIGGYEFRQITSINEEQVKAGEKPIEIRTFSTFADAFQALRAGQVDAVVSVDVNAKYYQDRGDFERAVSGLRGSPATLAFQKKEVAMAVLKALNDMRQDGAYDKLMDKWGAAKMPADKPLELKGPDMP